MSATSAGAIVYTVDANVQGFVNNMQTVDKELDGAQQGFQKADKEAAKLETGLSKLGAAFAALGIARALGSATELINKYDEMADRVRGATSSQAEFLMVQDRLATSADNTYRSLSEAQEVYIRTADALKSMGYNTSQALDVTDSLSYAMVRNAASADKAQTAIGAFSKAIQTGKVDADGWSSILAATPTIVNDVATAAGKTAEEIRKMGAQGKLTAEMLTQGLLKSLEDNKAASDAMATSTKDAFRQLENSLGATLSALNQQTGALDSVVSGIKLAAQVVKDFGNNAEGMANFLQIAGTAAAATATVIAGRLVGSLGAYAAAQTLVVRETLGAVNASNAQAGAALMLARNELAAAEAMQAKLVAVRASNLGMASAAATNEAVAAASARVAAAQAGVATALAGTTTAATYTTAAMSGLRAVMTFLGGPLGVILIAAAALTYFASEAGKTKVDVDNLKSSLDKLSFAQLSKASNDAGDDIVTLNKKLAASYSEINTLSKRFYESDTDFEKRKTEAQATRDGIQQEIDKRKQLQETIKAQQDQLAKDSAASNSPAAPRERKTSDADQGVLDNLEKQRQLALLAGEARARLAAEQKLSADASDEEKKAAGDLAVEIYRLEEAKKAVGKTSKENAAQQKKDDTEAIRAAEQNAKAISDYAVSIGLAAMKGEDLAKAQAAAKLNKFATPADVAVMQQLGQAMAVVQKQNELRAAQSQVSPLGQEVAAYTQQMATLSELQAADAANYQYYQDLKTAAAMDHDEKVRALEEAAFIRQSEGNAFLMRSIDALGQATTNTITGLLSGTLNAQDAMKGFASIILNEVVGSIVQMGVQAVKQALIQKSVQAAAAAGYVASVAAQVSVNTALAAQAAFASTAAIPVVGPAAAPAAAAAAGAAAAGLGAPAVASAAGVAAGGRLYGGPVSGDNMYAVSEDGKPEILEQDNGKRYLLGGQGNVVSNKDMGGGANIAVSIVIHSDGSQSTQSSSNNDINAMAENVKSVVINQLQLEMRQGGTLWEFQNGRT